MLPTLLAALLLVQDSGTTLSSPYDRVIELEITEFDEPAIDGRGGTVLAEYEVQFTGALHIWTSSELDLFLRVDDGAKALELRTDDDSGGGTTPYVELEVQDGDWLVIFVAGVPGSVGPLTLHAIAAPQTKAGRAAAEAAQVALTKAARLRGEGDTEGARNVAMGVMPTVLSTLDLDHPDLLRARVGLANLTHDVALAHAVRQSIVRGYQRCLPPDHPTVLYARSDLAASLWQRGDLAGALAHQEAVVAGFGRTVPENHPDLLRVMGNLAILLTDMGKVAQANAVQAAVLQTHIRTLPKDHPDLLAAQANLAKLLDNAGDLVGARRLQESVLAGYQRHLPKDHPDLLRAQSNLAISLGKMGDIARSRALDETVLSAYERSLPEGHPDLLVARENLAGSMVAMGDSVGAHAIYESALVTYQQSLPEDHPSLLRARVNLASSKQMLGDLAGARVLAELAVEGYERFVGKDHPALLHSMGLLASLMYMSDDVEDADALYQSIFALNERNLPEDHPARLESQWAMGMLVERSGDIDGARKLYESVLVIREQGLPEDHPDLLHTWQNLASLMQATGDAAGARELLRKLASGMAARVVDSLTLAPRQARQTVASESQRVSALYAMTESAGEELETRVFELMETMRLVSGEAARWLARIEGDSELAAILNEAAQVRRELNDLIAGSAHRADMEADEISAGLTRLSLRRDQLERAAARRLSDQGGTPGAVDSIALAAALEPGDMAVGFRRLVRWENIDEPDERLVAHVLAPQMGVRRVDLGPIEELEELADAWRQELGAPLAQGHGFSRGVTAENGEPAGSDLKAGRDLRRRLLDPILELAGENLTQLFLCADDLLFLLPLDALPLDSPRSGEGAERKNGVDRVGDRLRIVNEVSFSRLIAPGDHSDAPPSMLVLGSVDYDALGVDWEGSSAASPPIESSVQYILDGSAEHGGFPPAVESDELAAPGSTRLAALPGQFSDLPQANRETESTADQFKGAFEVEASLLTRQKSSKAALFESAPGKRYVHIATHGWFAPESVRSTEDTRSVELGFARMAIEDRVTGLAPMTLCGLALAGANRGRDSLGRVPGILTAEELCSLDLSQCELAVLSACETNVGIRRAGQGIQSLQSALYAAGARTSITSLWKVDDAATRRLMEAFYDNLWVQRMGKSDALWQAKQTMRDEGDPPAHWAGWVLTGDPD